MNSNFTMRDMAVTERPYEKCQQSGPSTLNDAELLAVILRSGSRKENALVTAQRILNRHSVHKGLVGLKHLTLEELMSIDGIGYVKAIQMQCIGELSRRIAEAEYKPFLTFGNPQSIADYFMERTKYLDKERVYSLLFDSRHCLLGENCISEGTIDHAVISPRDIFIDALSYHAAYVVLLHNHPSGNPEPSRQDICLTKRVAEAGRMLGILLSDHIIIGNNCFVSLAERGMLNETS